MSLVGSLEDLGLGDILQIISLSRKSGLLQLRSEEGEGRIVFCDGLVRAGFVKGEVEDLKGLLVAGGFVAEAAFDKAATIAASHGDPLDGVLETTSAISGERIDSLRREQVERSVFRMFGWVTGEFSFEISDTIDDRDLDLMVSTGINAQYLTMEATRLGDEDEKEQDDDIQFGMIDDECGDDDLVVKAAVEGENAEIADTLAMAAVERTESDEANAAVDSDVETSEIAEAAEAQSLDVQVEAAPAEMVEESLPAAEVAEPVVAAVETEPESEPEAGDTAPESSSLAALILIDSDLASLEWQKSVLGPICRRIHVFQRAEGGISRLRQYLVRGEEPVVLVSEDLPADSRAGIDGSLDLIQRMRAQAPRMRIYRVDVAGDHSAGQCGEANAVLQRPANHQLSNRRAWSKLEGDGERLRDELLAGLRTNSPERDGPSGADGKAPARSSASPNDAHSDLQRLKRTSERLRDPSVRGEVLSLILEFAAELFSRVAIFMVRDDEAIGMAQVGLAKAGGPDDSGFRQVSIPANEPSWFRSVLQSGEGEQSAPRDDGDRKLAAMLGSSIPKNVYVAPIESSQNAVALIYADNLPGDAPIADTTSLEIVLHEAGLALERALLERALAEASDQRSA